MWLGGAYSSGGGDAECLVFCGQCTGFGSLHVRRLRLPLEACDRPEQLSLNLKLLKVLSIKNLRIYMRKHSMKALLPLFRQIVLFY